MTKNYYVPNKYIAGILGIFVGGIGIHHFYTRRNNIGVVFLLVTICLSWTGIVPIVMALIGFFQGISYFFYSDQKWRSKLFIESIEK